MPGVTTVRGGLTPRSTGAATAGHLGPAAAGCTLSSSGPRRPASAAPVSSNVRPPQIPMLPSAGLSLLCGARASDASEAQPTPSNTASVGAAAPPRANVWSVLRGATAARPPARLRLPPPCLAVAPPAHGFGGKAGSHRSTRRPNPSLNRSSYGRPPWPGRSRVYIVFVRAKAPCLRCPG